MAAVDVYDKVQAHYGTAAKESGNAAYGERVARAFGYSEEELDGTPNDANLGLSCGNPLVLAKLKESEVVIDLGSGAGFDVFQAAKTVGSSGRVIGVDMNEDMLHKADQIKQRLAVTNVEFVKSRITKLDLPDATADCVISNCVVNLVPEEDKHLVFEEMYRVLKPGGRIAVSDILAKGLLPDTIKNSMALYVGCIAGASEVAAYEKYLNDAGFKDILIVDAKTDLNVYRQSDTQKTGCCGRLNEGNGQKTFKSAQAATLEDFDDVDFNRFAGSFKIYAIKL